MKILVIDNYDSFTYNLVTLLQSEATEISVRRNDRIELSEIEPFDKLVFSPGPGIPDEAGLMKKIIAAYGNSKPMLGVCLGHQAIAEVFGGSIFQLEKVMHGKSSEITLAQECPLFTGLPESIVAARYHSWAVSQSDLPDCLLPTASFVDADLAATIMGIQHNKLPIFGLQFHPESILSPEGATIIQNFIEV